MNNSTTSFLEHSFLAMQGFPEGSSPDDQLPRFHELDFEALLSELNITSVRNTSNDGMTAFQSSIWYLNLYLTPGIILVGLVGNLLSFLVFTFTHVQRLSASIYLSSLAVADIVFLVALAIVWMDRRLGIIIFVREGVCQFVVYITKVAGFIAVWYVLGFTAERYIIAYHPLMKDVLCTRQKATIVVIGLCVCALLFYSYVIGTYDVMRFGSHVACAPLPKYHDVTNIFVSIDTFIACVIPSVVIVILNIKIFIKIHQYQQKRSNSQSDLSHYRVIYRNRSLLHTSISTTGNVHIRFSTHHVQADPAKKEKESHEMTTQCQAAVRTRSHFRTARMLLVLSSVFVLLNLPYHIFRIHSYLGHLIGVGPKEPKNKKAWHELFQLFYFINFAINFFIYSACGQQFRVGLKRLAKKTRRKLSSCKRKLHKKSPGDVPYDT